MERKRRYFIEVTVVVFFILTQATSDDPATNFSNFERSIEICNKCDCTTYSKLYILNCANKDLHQTLDNWPSHENKTLRATFSHNLITSLGKFPATNCSATLSLDHCGIKYLTTGLFENMKNVRYVDLSYNLITIEQLSSDKFKGPYSNKEFEPIELTHLNLAYNQIHSLPQSLFEHTPRLKDLNLEGNNFKVLDLQTQVALSSVPKLEHLNLANNGLKNLPDFVFSTFKQLVRIDLSKNEMTFVPNVLARVENLEVLILDSNPIFELTDGTFNGLQNLVELSLNNLSNVMEIHSNTFAPLKKLMKLHLSDNRDLEIFEPDAFGVDDNLSLKELYMNNNGLIDIPSILLDWSSLHIMEFNNNPLICTCNLYNISRSLSRRITVNEAGPFCIGEEEMSYQVFSLDERVCHEDYVANFSFRNNIQKKFSIIRISLITLSLVALTAAFIALVVCYAKQKKYGFLGQSQFSRSTTVLYNPLNRQSTL